jgi:hypothetical protein
VNVPTPSDILTGLTLLLTAWNAYMLQRMRAETLQSKLDLQAWVEEHFVRRREHDAVVHLHRQHGEGQYGVE